MSFVEQLPAIKPTKAQKGVEIQSPTFEPKTFISAPAMKSCCLAENMQLANDFSKQAAQVLVKLQALWLGPASRNPSQNSWFPTCLLFDNCPQTHKGSSSGPQLDFIYCRGPTIKSCCLAPIKSPKDAPAIGFSVPDLKRKLQQY